MRRRGNVKKEKQFDGKKICSQRSPDSNKMAKRVRREKDDEDGRFAHVAWDPKFRSLPTRQRKVVVDERFSEMFKGDGRFGQTCVNSASFPRIFPPCAELPPIATRVQ